MSKTCVYCQKETVYVPLQFRSSSGHKHTMEVHYCYDCAAEYVHWGQVNSKHLYTVINNRTYRWSIEIDGSLGRLWAIDEPGVPGKSPNRGLTVVKSFGDKYPTITPQNVNEKLRFILLFL